MHLVVWWCLYIMVHEDGLAIDASIVFCRSAGLFLSLIISVFSGVLGLSVLLSVCDHILNVCEHDILTNRLRNFTKFVRYSWRLSWSEKIMRSNVNRSRSLQTTYGQISTVGGIFSGTHWHIIMKLITVIHYQVLTTLMTFSRSWVQRSRSQTTFLNACFSCCSAGSNATAQLLSSTNLINSSYFPSLFVSLISWYSYLSLWTFDWHVKLI